MTAGETSFRLYVTHVLNKILSPEYRQFTVEALRALASIVRDNPGLFIDDTLVIDILIGHAVRLNWFRDHPDQIQQYEESVALAWQVFYLLPPPPGCQLYTRRTHSPPGQSGRTPDRAI